MTPDEERAKTREILEARRDRYEKQSADLARNQKRQAEYEEIRRLNDRTREEMEARLATARGLVAGAINYGARFIAMTDHKRRARDAAQSSNQI